MFSNSSTGDTLICEDFNAFNLLSARKKLVSMILLRILENEDSYKDLEFIISKVNFYSS